jgi:hypothetical protein
LLKDLSSQRLNPGKYQLEVEVQDQISEHTVTARDELQILASAQPNEDY